MNQRKRPQGKRQPHPAADRSRASRLERQRRTRQTVVMLILVVIIAAMVLATV